MKIKYRKNSQWSSLTIIYNTKEPLDEVIQHKLNEKYKGESVDIDIVDINITATKSYIHKDVVVLYAII